MKLNVSKNADMYLLLVYGRNERMFQKFNSFSVLRKQLNALTEGCYWFDIYESLDGVPTLNGRDIIETHSFDAIISIKNLFYGFHEKNLIGRKGDVRYYLSEPEFKHGHYGFGYVTGYCFHSESDIRTSYFAHFDNFNENLDTCYVDVQKMKILFSEYYKLANRVHIYKRGGKQFDYMSNLRPELINIEKADELNNTIIPKLIIEILGMFNEQTK